MLRPAQRVHNGHRAFAIRSRRNPFGHLQELVLRCTADPFDEFRRIGQDMDDAFGWSSPAAIRSVARGTFPPINVGATPDGMHVYVFAPGLDPKSVDVTIQQNLLTISGRREVPAASLPTPASL